MNFSTKQPPQLIMYLSILIFSAFSLHVHANNLNCLSWDPDLVPAGLYCHFKSDAPSPPEVAADKAVKSFVKDVYGAFKLASMQMPVELSAYFANGGDLLETASSNGLQLRSPSDDLFAVDVQYADVKLDLIDGTQATIMDLRSVIIQSSFLDDFVDESAIVESPN